MEAKCRTLEITVLSAESLRMDAKPVKNNTSVVVKIDPFNYQQTKESCERGSNPSWNEKLVIDMPTHIRLMTLEVRSGNRVVGIASIPLSDFVGEYPPENYLHFLSYRLRDARSQRNGIINISIRSTNMPLQLPLPLPLPPYHLEPSLGVAVAGNKYYGGVVTGVPVWFNSHA